MTDVVLINPAAAHGIYGPLGDGLIAVEPPLWLRLTAAYLRRRGFVVEVIDAERDRASPDGVAELVGRLDPRLVILVVMGHQPSASTQQMFGAREVALALQKMVQAPVAIMGGHPSALPRRTLLEEPVDFVIKGEGPATIAAMLENPTRSNIAGLVYPLMPKPYESHQVVVNDPPPALEPDVDLVEHGWEHTPPHRYVAHNWHALSYPDADRTPYASIYTSLNCPYKCEFCCISSPFGAPGYKTRDPKLVVDEVEFLVREYGVRFIKVVDEMFILKPSHYLAIAEGLIERGLGELINVWAYARVDTVTAGALPTLRRAGFRWLALGIESGSARVRDGANKRLRTSDIVGTVRRIQAEDVNVIGNFMFGLRDDDQETMRQTLDLALECRPDWANFYSCMAYPGSKLYDQAIRDGWTLPTEWRGYSQHNADCRPLDTEHVDGATVLAFRDRAFHIFFENQVYRDHLTNRFGTAGIAAVDKMLEYRLERNLLSTEEKPCP